MRELVFDPNALEDLEWWIRNNPRIGNELIDKANKLIGL